MFSKYTLEDIRKLAAREWKPSKFRDEYERLQRNRIARELKAESTDTCFKQDHATVSIFCEWCATKGYPVYHVAESTVSIAETFSALYNHEYVR